VNDHVGRRIERVDVGDRASEIMCAPIGVGRIERQMGVGDVRDDRCAAKK
jgi:hypothetical protein